MEQVLEDWVTLHELLFYPNTFLSCSHGLKDRHILVPYGALLEGTGGGWGLWGLSMSSRRSV